MMMATQGAKRSRRTLLFLWSLVVLAFVPRTASSFNLGWSIYSDLLVKSPLATKAITSSCTNALSDVLCQKLVIDASSGEEEADGVATTKASFDSQRFRDAAITGLVWSGPVTHYWYKILFGHLTVRMKDPVLKLMAQIVLDAIIFSPVTVSGYFTVRSVLEGSGWRGVKDKLSTRLFSTVLGAWKFWPAANVINFSLVPLQFRVLYMNVLSVFWSGYLTYVNSKKMSSKSK